MAEKKIELSMLCDIYGGLLSEKHRDAVELYCNEDYSLAEIAEHTGISRQGVRDQIKHAESQLYAYEEALGLLKKTGETGSLLDKLVCFDEIKNNGEILQIISSIQEKLNF